MRFFVLIVLVLAGILSPVMASAGDRVSANSPPPVIGPHPPIWRFNGPPQDPPFSRSAALAVGMGWRRLLEPVPVLLRLEPDAVPLR